jgi:hypothetical protein
MALRGGGLSLYYWTPPHIGSPYTCCLVFAAAVSPTSVVAYASNSRRDAVGLLLPLDYSGMQTTCWEALTHRLAKAWERRSKLRNIVTTSVRLFTCSDISSKTLFYHLQVQLTLSRLKETRVENISSWEGEKVRELPLKHRRGFVWASKPAETTRRRPSYSRIAGRRCSSRLLENLVGWGCLRHYKQPFDKTWSSCHARAVRRQITNCNRVSVYRRSTECCVHRKLLCFLSPFKRERSVGIGWRIGRRRSWVAETKSSAVAVWQQRIGGRISLRPSFAYKRPNNGVS